MTFHHTNRQETTAHGVLKRLGFLRPGWFPTFQEFVPLLNPMMNTYGAWGISLADQSATGQLLYAMCVVHNAGAPVFRLRPDLAKMLRETDVPKDMGIELLRLPFEGICLDFPKGILAPPAHEVSRLYLMNFPGERFRMVCLPDDDTTHHASLRMPGAKDDLRQTSTTIAAAVEETKSRAFEGISPSAAEQLKAGWMYDDYFECDMFTFSVNAALYLTSEGADVEQDKTKIHELHAKLQGLKKKSQRERLERELKEEKEHKIYICGMHTKLAREMSAQLTEEGRKVTKRFRVRGHWKNQACGPRWQDHKHIFLQPFWKGPTFAEMLERNYVVGSKDAEADQCDRQERKDGPLGSDPRTNGSTSGGTRSGVSTDGSAE